ncbi:hypothetical protein AB3U99_21015 [Niallia sp. JL1B1071]|uniref:hypothetical protein n=1 Tax=Niallia tiangongensis TaxID=3237105 RepID=UPI0037DD2069
MKSQDFGVHEVTDMRELINFKGACLAQSKARLEKVENEELKQLIEKSVELGTTSLNQMKNLLSKASTQIIQ